MYVSFYFCRLCQDKSKDSVYMVRTAWDNYTLRVLNINKALAYFC